MKDDKFKPGSAVYNKAIQQWGIVIEDQRNDDAFVLVCYKNPVQQLFTSTNDLSFTQKNAFPAKEFKICFESYRRGIAEGVRIGLSIGGEK